LPIIRESGTRNHVSPYGRRRFFPNRELNAYTRFFHIKKPGHAGLPNLLSFKADIVFYFLQPASHPIQLHINSGEIFRHFPAEMEQFILHSRKLRVGKLLVF
jgi:hypothetical protein